MYSKNNAKSNSSFNDEGDEDDDDTSLDNLAKLRDSRRLKRLYGSNIRNVAKSKNRQKQQPLISEVAKKVPTNRSYPQSPDEKHSLQTYAQRVRTASSVLKCFQDAKANERGGGSTAMTTTSISRLAQPKITVKKFRDRSKEEKEITEMHADNEDDVLKAWFVGYQNSATLPAGSPLAITSRYGFNSAIQLTKQCFERLRTTDLELAANDNRGISSNASSMKQVDIESDLVRVNEWVPPLIASPHGVTCGKLGGGGHFASTPKLWPGNNNNSCTGLIGITRPSTDMCRPFSESCTWYDRQTTSRGEKTQAVDSSVARRPHTRPGFSVNLQRALDRESDEWKQVAEGAINEKLKGTNSSSKVPPLQRPRTQGYSRNQKRTNTSRLYILG
mmetsp:Transcript_21162/g.31202  ORF Transcript_21162/g.31202 Transcript_21162/m.31202 type:complete len:388 (+) Transcript_21162:163-1326(+)